MVTVNWYKKLKSGDCYDLFRHVGVRLASWLRGRRDLIADYINRNKSTATGRIFYLRSCAIGLLTGFLSGAFGIGATAFIQISLMMFFGVSLYHAIGTTMMIILPIAASGGLSYLAGAVIFC